ncbi:MAG: amino acid transporter [Rhodobacteraceae bacterium]|nr:MAG: amino acid transporter [Paracoccaceae bacterium]
MAPLVAPATTGFLTAFALILAIGAQNAFVLKQGIARSHVFWVCLTCAVSDALLITAGVAGFGLVVAQFPSLPRIMSLGGGAFLVAYGLTRFVAAYRGGDQMALTAKAAPLGTTILICLSLTWLNPHVYLDTLGLIGAVSTQFIELPQKVAFGVGAVAASFVFFFGLGYGARLLAPIMQTPRTWQVLDVMIGLLMWYLAYGLLTS